MRWLDRRSFWFDSMGFHQIGFTPHNSVDSAGSHTIRGACAYAGMPPLSNRPIQDWPIDPTRAWLPWLDSDWKPVVIERTCHMKWSPA